MRKLLLLAAATAALAALPAQAAAPTTSAWDKEWVEMGIAGDRFEITGGQMALKTSQTDAVKTLARTLVADHTKSLKESIALAKRIGAKVPAQPEPSMQWELQVLRKSSGADFDRMYSSLEAKDHQQDIHEAQDEVSMGSDPRVRASAKKELPMLKKHLALSTKAQSASA